MVIFDINTGSYSDYSSFMYVNEIFPVNLETRPRSRGDWTKTATSYPVTHWLRTLTYYVKSFSYIVYVLCKISK